MRQSVAQFVRHFCVNTHGIRGQRASRGAKLTASLGVNETVPRRFQLVSRLGGSAVTEAHLCRLQGVEGFEKEVVLKRITPEHAIDSRLVRMFLDEARMAARLSHPNIVQVLEVGQGVCGPYAAMEYV